MSCVTFWTPAMRAKLRLAAGAGPVSTFVSPPASEAKLRRLRLLALDPSARIRESAALASHAPEDVLRALATDGDVGVRSCVARNPGCPVDVLRALADDRHELVRGWVAANPAAPADLLGALGGDDSAVVRRVVGWARDWPDVSDQPRSMAVGQPEGEAWPRNESESSNSANINSPSANEA